MAESREKSEQLRSEFEQVIGGSMKRNGVDGEYIDADVYAVWRLCEKFRRAGRRDALEEAMKAICYHCRMGIPVDPPSESLSLWHRDRNSGRLDICQAAAIRALSEKGPE